MSDTIVIDGLKEQRDWIVSLRQTPPEAKGPRFMRAKALEFVPTSMLREMHSHESTMIMPTMMVMMMICRSQP
jgi:hypothetical protein